MKRRFQLQRGGAEGWRPRAALAAVVAGCVAVTGIAVAGAGNASPGMKFTEQGQWIYNSTIGAVLHVHGSTKNVDIRVPLPGAGPGTQIVESDKSGFVLARGRTYEFGKSDLQVLDPKPAPVNEQAVGLSAGGAVFAVYRKAGSIARLGENPAVDTPGVPLGPPVVTSNGTLWVHRPDNGQLCQLPLDADRLSCPAKAPLGHSGALTVVGNDQVVFVDLTGRAMYSVTAGGLGRQVALPFADLPGTAIIAQNDLAGRVAIVDPQRNVLHLVDTSELTSGRSGAVPIEKPLRKGKYERIASSGNSLALIDDSTDTLLTVDRDGNETDARPIPPPSKDSEVDKGDHSGLYRGSDSRLYVASRSGEQVMVVDDTGEVTPVDTGATQPDKPKPAPKPTVQPSKPPVQPPPTTTQPPATEPPPTQPTRKPVEPPKPQDPRTTEPKEKPSKEPTRRPTNNPPSTEQTKPPPPPATNKPDPKPTVRASRPGAPRSVSGRAGTSSAVINWEAAAPNGAAITSYQVSWSGGSRTLAASARSTTVTGLTNGTGYTFSVRAVNRVGPGAASSTARLVPVDAGGVPDAPPNFTVTNSTTMNLRWQPANLRGTKLVNYQYEAQSVTPSVPQFKSGRTTTTSGTLTGLRAGASYRVTVMAVATRGTTLVYGKKASRTVTIGGGTSDTSPKLTASRGADTTHDGGEQSCEAPGCAFIRVVGRGLKPNTFYSFQPFTTQWQPSNPGATLQTDSSGNITIDDRFATNAPGQEVWVVATADGEEPVTSNKFTWRTP